jgi:hypothetical protein
LWIEIRDHAPSAFLEVDKVAEVVATLTGHHRQGLAGKEDREYHGNNDSRSESDLLPRNLSPWGNSGTCCGDTQYIEGRNGAGWQTNGSPTPFRPSGQSNPPRP